MKTEHFAFALLHKAHQVAREAFDDGNLTPTQYLILRAICEMGDGVIQTTLVESTGVDRSTMADVLRRMEREELITRTVSPKDCRANEIGITPKGRKALTSATGAAARANAAILRMVPQSQRRAFLSNLERIGKGPVQAVREAA